MTPAAKASLLSAAGPLVRVDAGRLLAAAYLGVGLAGYLLAGQDSTGGSLPVLWTAIAVAAGSAVVLRRPSPLEASVARWVCPALVGPIAIYPLFGQVLAPGSPSPALAGMFLLAATLPMAVAIAQLAPADRGNLARAAVPAVGLAAAVLVMLPGSGSTTSDWVARLFAVAALAWPTALAFAVLLRRGRRAGVRPAGEVLGDAALLVAAVGPVVTGSVLFMPWIYALTLVGLAALAVFAAFRVAVRPLAAISARAAAQRDLAVTVSEAERARLAADLHDGPLQDLLILARSLDARNDADGARLARDVADELREMSGDLRLPVLDDLGAGPALEWLAARVRRLTGLDVAAEWEADGRAPREVELAAFRVAQEAVSNAVRHGRPPVRIRCSATSHRLRLTIEDAGDGRGLDAPAAPRAPNNMRRGMLGMAQRAEQIGATLDVRRAEGRGTIVVLEWGPPAA
jgi:signal transduction histidine kinase